MDITIKENINNIKDTQKKSSFAKFNIAEQLPSTNNLYDTYLIERDEKIYKMNLFRFGESVNLDIFEKLNNIKNVNHLVESGQEGDRHYLLWEVLDYPNIGEVEVPIDEFLRKISTILSNLHKKKIYHLNLNLENIKVKNTNPLEVIIDDFASASITDAEASKKLTNVKGIDSFQSPELSLGIASSKSDYWSLGIILYYLLTKTLPEKNTYTKEILLDNIPSKYENLIKGLLLIDLNKRYDKEEIDIVLGGGKVEEIADINSTLNSFTYEGKTFNSLEDFALFLHNEKNGLDTFKKLLYRGYFDKYYDKDILLGIKSDLGRLNAFYYRYGEFGQKPLFEGINIYNHFLWFSTIELELINYRNDSTRLLSEFYDTFVSDRRVSKFHKDFKGVRHLINFDMISPSQKALDKIKNMSLTHVDSKTIRRGGKEKKLYAVNYLYLQKLVKEDKDLEFLRLALPYEEISKIPREELATYIQYKYVFSDFKVEGYSEKADFKKYLPEYLFDLKYFYRYCNDKNFSFTSTNNLCRSVKKMKTMRQGTKYYLKHSEDNDLIKKVIELEENPDFFSYFSYITTKHLDVNMDNLIDSDKSIVNISELINEEKDFKNFRDNISLNNLNIIYKNIDNKEYIKKYLIKNFKGEESKKFADFDYNQVNNKNDTFKNFCIALEEVLSINKVDKYELLLSDNYNSLSNSLDKNKDPVKNPMGIVLSVIIIMIIISLFK